MFNPGTQAWLFLHRLRHRLRTRRQFYSPVVNPYDPRVRRILEHFPTSELSQPGDILIDRASMLQMLRNLATFYPDLPFSDEPQANRKTRYFYENPAFSYGDAITLFGMIRYHKPQRLIEVGSGYSSCIIMDTNDLFFNGAIDLTFIDPYPANLQRLLLPQDERYRACIRADELQDVPTDVFLQLCAGDILFLDSSHVAKLGSDVNDYMFRILPALASGVIVHVHDIPYPFEYPPDWVLREQRSWNEAYLLRAFLQYNRAFEIIYFNHFVMRHFASDLAQHMPLCLKNGGASIWLKKI